MKVVELATARAAKLGVEFLRIILHDPPWLREIRVERDQQGKPSFVLYCHELDRRIRNYVPKHINDIPVRLVRDKAKKSEQA